MKILEIEFVAGDLEINFKNFDRFNIIHGKNEAGKTTLLNFIRYIFYPFQKNRFWFLDELKANGKLIFEGKEYIFQINRRDSLYLPDGDFLKKIGERIDYEVFKNTFAITQEELFQIEFFDLLNKKRELLLGLSGIENFMKIGDVLDDLNKEREKLYKERGRKPLLNKLKDELRRLEKDLKEKEREIVNYQYELKELDEKKRKLVLLGDKLNSMRDKISNYQLKIEPFEDYEKILRIESKIKDIKGSGKTISDEDYFLCKENSEKLKALEIKFRDGKARLNNLAKEFEEKPVLPKRLIESFKKYYFEKVELDEEAVRRNFEESYNFLNRYINDFDKLDCDKLKKLLIETERIFKQKKDVEKGILELEEKLKGFNYDSLKKRLFEIENENKILSEKSKESSIRKEIENEINFLKSEIEESENKDFLNLYLFYNLLKEHNLEQYEFKELKKLYGNLLSFKITFLVTLLGAVISFIVFRKGAFSFIPLLLLFTSMISLIVFKFKLKSFNMKALGDLKSIMNNYNSKYEKIDFNEIGRKAEEIKLKKLRLDELVKKLKMYDSDYNGLDEKLEKLKMEKERILRDMTKFEMLLENLEKLKDDLAKLKAEEKEYLNKLEESGVEIGKIDEIMSNFDGLLEGLEFYNQGKKDIELLDKYYEVESKLKSELNLNYGGDRLYEKLEELIANENRKMHLGHEIYLLKNELSRMDLEIKQLKHELDELLAKNGLTDLSEIESAYENYKDGKKLLSDLNAEKKIFYKKHGLTFEEYSKIIENEKYLILKEEYDDHLKALRNLESEYEELRLEVARLDERLKVLIDEDKVYLIEREIEKRKMDFEEYYRRFLVYSVASKILDSSLKRYETEFQPKIIKNCVEYFGEFTVGEYTDVKVDFQGRLYVIDRKGNIKSINELSAGTKDQLYLALRLAYIDIVDDDLNLPLFFDEVTVNFDIERENCFMSTLDKISKNRQVFFFTCKGIDSMEKYDAKIFTIV